VNVIEKNISSGDGYYLAALKDRSYLLSAVDSDVQFYLSATELAPINNISAKKMFFTKIVQEGLYKTRFISPREIHGFEVDFISGRYHDTKCLVPQSHAPEAHIVAISPRAFIIRPGNPKFSDFTVDKYEFLHEGSINFEIKSRREFAGV